MRKILLTFLLLTVFAAVYAVTVEEAWESYRVNPKKPGNPDWVKPIPDFETFKRQWDEAKAYNAKYATTQDAWKAYKVKDKKFNAKVIKTKDFISQDVFGLSFPPEEDKWRFEIFKKAWQKVLDHNEKYALGDIYYPILSWTYMHETKEEEEERWKQPIN